MLGSSMFRRSQIGCSKGCELAFLVGKAKLAEQTEKIFALETENFELNLEIKNLQAEVRKLKEERDHDNQLSENTVALLQDEIKLLQIANDELKQKKPASVSPLKIPSLIPEN